jgi:LPXTG-site transpeptidase (sortase) family protein
MAKVRIGVGLLMVWGALGVLGYRLGWQIHSQHGQAALLGSARSAALHASGACTSASQAADGQLAGVLAIPALGVTAPVEGGTGDGVLNVAVGHADGTPWPGSPGTSVLLAHDVSYFAKLGQLKPGDTIDYRSGCVVETFKVTGHQVVKAGSAIPDVPGAGLVLDTCWPTNALWYTPNRYLVQAVESSIATTKKAHQSEHPSTTGSETYTTPAPPALVATGIDLEHNEEPMGTMTLGGSPSSAWAQSPAPLSVEAAALQDYFGALHAAAGDRSDWWSAVAPGVAMPDALRGAQTQGSAASPLDVTITAQGDQPQAVVLSTDMPLNGPNAWGTYHLQITEAIHGTTVVITNWEMNHV